MTCFAAISLYFLRPVPFARVQILIGVGQWVFVDRIVTFFTRIVFPSVGTIGLQVIYGGAIVICVMNRYG